MNEIVAKDLPIVIVAKQEMDRSYDREAESGFQSSFASVSKTESENSWVVLEGEIADPQIFDPPIHSSNIEVNLHCNISTKDPNEHVATVLWYRGSQGEPIFT